MEIVNKHLMLVSQKKCFNIFFQIYDINRKAYSVRLYFSISLHSKATMKLKYAKYMQNYLYKTAGCLYQVISERQSVMFHCILVTVM